jgi:acetyl-CoA acetyltransferase family protein
LIETNEASLVIAGGVESMSRAPYVISKAETGFSRQVQMFDTTLGWRFANDAIRERYGVDSMPETAERVARLHNVCRAAQDEFALRSQRRAMAAQRTGVLAAEINPITVRLPDRRVVEVSVDERPRETSLEALARLPTPFSVVGSVTAGNSSGVNDGACALLLASEAAATRFGLTPRARVLGSAVVGVEPGLMGMGPVPASKRLLERLRMTISEVDVVELNEAFAAQALAVLRELGLADDAQHVNPNGGAIAFGHPLGASGARLATTAMYHLQRTAGRLALCTMCIGVGQGIAVMLERVH